MNIVFKSTLRNIKSKLGRSLILIICVAITAFLSVLCISGRNMIESTIDNIMKAASGTIDFTVTATSLDSFEGCPEADISGFAGVKSLHSGRLPEKYYISYSVDVLVYNFSDYHSLYEMGQIGTDIDVSGNEAYVSERYAELYGVQVGDVVTVYGSRSSVSADITIKGIANIPPTAPVSDVSVFVSPEVICTLAETTEPDYIFYFVDVKDDSQIDEFETQLKANDYKARVESLYDESWAEDEYNNYIRIFLFIFLFTFLLVIFVTVNFSEKVVNERMSLIGTLRSLGVTREKTSLILILENVFYGLIGSLIGVLIHALVMPVVLSQLAMMEVGMGAGTVNAMDYYYQTPLWVYLVVIIGAIVIECLCPLFALLKAVKTPIRDIIFQNKDTKFVYNWSRLYFGVILILAAIVCSFLRKSFLAICISLACTIVSLAVLTPFILKGISMLGEKYLSSNKTPILKLAIKEVSNNKHMVATSVLCVTTIILSTCLNSLAISVLNDVTGLEDDYDVDIQFCEMEDRYYSFIDDLDGVISVERFKVSYYEKSRICGVEKEFEILCDTESDSKVQLSELTGSMAFTDVAVTKTFAEENGLKVGDKIDVSIGIEYRFPVSFEGTVAIILENFGHRNDAIAVSKEMHSKICNGDHSLGSIYIKCEEGRTDEVRQMLCKYLTDDEDHIKTKEMAQEQMQESNRRVFFLIYGVIAAGVMLTIIGTSGNQLLAFESRRRELAVLYSIAMNKQKLKKLILLESALSIGIGIVLSLIFGGLVSRFFGDAMIILTSGTMPDITYSFGAQLLYVCGLFVILMAIVLQPFSRIDKMNCAQELKYE